MTRKRNYSKEHSNDGGYGTNYTPVPDEIEETYGMDDDVKDFLNELGEYGGITESDEYSE